MCGSRSVGGNILACIAATTSTRWRPVTPATGRVSPSCAIGARGRGNWMMTTNEPPIRVQLRRTKGWKMPPNTVKVDRTTPWGNPICICEPPHQRLIAAYDWKFKNSPDIPGTAAEAVAMFERFIAFDGASIYAGTKALRGRNLACWCPLDQPCHVDVCGCGSSTALLPRRKSMPSPTETTRDVACR